MSKCDVDKEAAHSYSSYADSVCPPGFEAGPDPAVLEEDCAGPLPAVPVRGIDWLFVFSVLFISGFTVYAILCSDSIRWLVPGQDHEHQD